MKALLGCPLLKSSWSLILPRQLRLISMMQRSKLIHFRPKMIKTLIIAKAFQCLYGHTSNHLSSSCWHWLVLQSAMEVIRKLQDHLLEHWSINEVKSLHRCLYTTNSSLYFTAPFDWRYRLPCALKYFIILKNTRNRLCSYFPLCWT